MVKKRKSSPFGMHRSKKGFPVYSREEIREQYCINRKEIQAFEDNFYHQGGGLFGCLSTGHLPENSPCNKNSSLLSCVQKAKCSTEIEPDDDSRGDNARGKYENYTDDEDSDGGFKRKFLPRLHALASDRHRYQWSRNRNTFHAIDRAPNTIFNSDNRYLTHGIRLTGNQLHATGQPFLPPSSSQFGQKENIAPIDSSSQNFEQACQNQDQWILSRGMMIKQSGKVVDHRIQPTTEIISSVGPSTSDERPKHVSFDSTSLVRSNTVSGGLEAPSSSNQDSFRCESGMDPSFVGKGSSIHSGSAQTLCNHSHERLISGSVMPMVISSSTVAVGDANSTNRLNSSIRSLDLAAISTPHSSSGYNLSCKLLPMKSPSMSTYYASKSSVEPCRALRRVVMKTQATQTDPRLNRSMPNTPAYPTMTRIALAQQIRTSHQKTEKISFPVQKAKRSEMPSGLPKKSSSFEHQIRPKINIPVSVGRSQDSKTLSRETGHPRAHSLVKSTESFPDNHMENLNQKLLDEHSKTKIRVRSRNLVRQSSHKVSETSPEPAIMIEQPKPIEKPKLPEPLSAEFTKEDEEDDLMLMIIGEKQSINYRSNSYDALEDAQSDQVCFRKHWAKKIDSDEEMDEIQPRRHSVATAEFSDEADIPLLYPPPGFEDVVHKDASVGSSQPEMMGYSSIPSFLDDGMAVVSTSPIPGPSVSPSSKNKRSQSSSDTSKALCSGATDDEQQSLTDMDDFDFKLHSGESPTIISEISSKIFSQSEDNFQAHHSSSPPKKPNEALEESTTGSMVSEPISEPASLSEPHEAANAPSTEATSVSITSSSVQRIRSLFEPSTSSSIAKPSYQRPSTSKKNVDSVLTESSTSSIGVEKRSKNMLRKVFSPETSSSGDLTSESMADSAIKPKETGVEIETSTEVNTGFIMDKPEKESSLVPNSPAIPMLEPKVSTMAFPMLQRRDSDEQKFAGPVSGDIAQKRRQSTSPKSPSSVSSTIYSFETIETTAESGSPFHQNLPSPKLIDAEQKSKISEHPDDFESDGMPSSNTPIHEACSSDPSTAFEFNTVIETEGKFVLQHNVEKSVEFDAKEVLSMTSGEKEIKDQIPKGLPLDLIRRSSVPKEEEKNLEDERGEKIEETQDSELKEEIFKQTKSTVEEGKEDIDIEASEGDPVESDDLDAFTIEEKNQDTADLELFCIRALSTELSTVSEVSEEISNQRSEIISSHTVPSSTSSSSSAPGLRESSSDETLNKSEKSSEPDVAKDDIRAEKAAFQIGYNRIDDESDSTNQHDRTEASSLSSYSQISLPGSSSVVEGHSSLPVDQRENQAEENEKISQFKANKKIKKEGMEKAKDTSPGEKVPVYGVEKENIPIENPSRQHPPLQRRPPHLHLRSDSAGQQPSFMATIKPMAKTGSLPCLPSEMIRPGENIIRGVPMLEDASMMEKMLSIGEELIGGDEFPDPLEDEELLPDQNRDIGQPDTAGESSQATDRDMARLEFTLTQHSSQEIDEESLSMIPHSTEKAPEALATSSSFMMAGQINILPNGGSNNMRNLIPVAAEIAPEAKNRETNGEQSVDELELQQDANSNEDRLRDDTSSNLESHERSASADEDVERQSIESERPTRSTTKSSDKQPPRSASAGDDSWTGQSDQVISKSVEHSEISSSSKYQASVGETSPSEHRKPYPVARKSRESSQKAPYRKSVTIDDMMAYKRDDDEDIGVYSDAYKCASWLYINKRDEFRIWIQRQMTKDISSATNSSSDHSSISSDAGKFEGMESTDSTVSEKEFRKHYEAITHRMIHRRASIELYSRLKENNFVLEKRVKVTKSNGEFGFRIHGSRPVVVSAIERGTPAESCGLEVGDIVVSVNGVNVLDASHSEVVRLAHIGSDVLKLELARTCGKLRESGKEMKEGEDTIFNGYIYRKSESDAHGMSPGSSGWKKRWFVLRTDCCLYWYSHMKDVKLLGVINLHGYTASLIPSPTGDSHQTIRLGKLEGPCSYLCATDEESASRWIDYINSAASKITSTNPYIERTLRNIHVRPMAIREPDCRGYLGIFGQKRKLWKQRYFVLKDACLYSYIDTSSSTALGVFYLQGYEVQSNSLVGKRNTFEISPPDRKMKRLWLMAESEIDKKRWLAALEYSIDKWIKLT